MDRFVEFWEGLQDPRTGNAALHDFHEILAIAMCAVLCGAQGSVDMGLFAKSKEPFLRGFLKLENGVPSHDTFSRRFRLLDRKRLVSHAAALARGLLGSPLRRRHADPGAGARLQGSTATARARV